MLTKSQETVSVWTTGREKTKRNMGIRTFSIEAVGKGKKSPPKGEDETRCRHLASHARNTTRIPPYLAISCSFLFDSAIRGQPVLLIPPLFLSSPLIQLRYCQPSRYCRSGRIGSVAAVMCCGVCYARPNEYSSCFSVFFQGGTRKFIILP